MKHLMILVLFLLVALPMRAQDIAPESTVEAGTVTILDGNGEGVDITITTPTETPVNAPVSADPMSTILQVVLAVCAVIVAISFAFEKLGNRAKAANANPFETAALEKLGDGVPSVVVLQITGALDRMTTAFENITAVWKEATDKTPAASKPAVSPNYAVTPTANLPKDVTNIHDLGGTASSGGEFR